MRCAAWTGTPLFPTQVSWTKILSANSPPPPQLNGKIAGAEPIVNFAFTFTFNESHMYPVIATRTQANSLGFPQFTSRSHYSPSPLPGDILQTGSVRNISNSKPRTACSVKTLPLQFPKSPNIPIYLIPQVGLEVAECVRDLVFMQISVPRRHAQYRDSLSLELASLC